VRLSAAAAAHQQRLGLAQAPGDHARLDARLGRVRIALGEERFSEVWSEGASLSISQAIELADEMRS
jgi:hypothetical protein